MKGRATPFLLLIAIVMPALRAQDDTADTAIDRGLAYLANEQNGDGSFAAPSDMVTTTSQAMLAFLSTGNTADGGRYAPIVRRATEFLLQQGHANQTHTMAPGARAMMTLALAQAYGVEPDETTRGRIRAFVKESAEQLLATQNTSTPEDAEICSNALEAAREIGIIVPRANIPEHPTSPATKPATEPASGQLKDGSWPDTSAGEANRVRSTSLAILRLSQSLQLRSIPLVEERK